MLRVADADNSGEIDVNEFLQLMTEQMGREGEERIRHAKTAFWALQSYLLRGICIHNESHNLPLILGLNYGYILIGAGSFEGAAGAGC